ncbi:MAG: GvpL/GvpF family gas vesicle protein [Acidobacteriota bacterium]
MSGTILYVYGIGREILSETLPEDLEAIDGTTRIDVISDAGLSAACTPVDEDEFGAAAVEKNSGNLEWLGELGVRHDAVVTALSEMTTIIPLRAFTLFGSVERLQKMLRRDRAALAATLDRLAGNEEWTVRIELDPESWTKAITHRVESLRTLNDEMESASPGRGYLLARKLEEARKSAAQEAEQSLVAELESAFARDLGGPVITETRQMREGSFPQINLLLPRGSENRLASVVADIQRALAGDGVTLRMTGPWPPYTFAAGELDG